MRIKIYFATLLAFVGVMAFGLCIKVGHKDLNSSSIDDFYVALFPDDLLSTYLDRMDDIDDSRYILEVVCTGGLDYKYSCAAQRAEVKKVFKGDGISPGDTIDILKIGHISHSAMSSLAFNIDFVNVMNVGETYLVFLDRRAETYDDWNLYVKHDDYLPAPILSYEERKQGFHEPEDKGTSTYTRYSEVKDEEFFLMSQESADKMRAFKEELLSRYPR